MRKDFGAKPFLFPQPIMIIGTYDEEGKANQQGIHCQHGRRGAYDSLRLRGACVWQQGRKQDGEGGFTTTESAFVHAPIINELPVTLECTLANVTDGSKFLGKIVNVSIERRWEMPSRTELL